MKPTLQEKYIKEVVPAVQKKFGIKNLYAVPRLQKIVVNMGVGEAINDHKIMDKAAEELSLITGQKPTIRHAKKAISNFKLKINAPIGAKVTLRRARMYEFMDRLLNVCLPRIGDFNGVARKSFDKEGNYTLGLKDQSIFPEVDAGRITHTQGMDITFVFNKQAKQTHEHTFEVLRLMGMPFTNQ